jgi:hypothetical protein
LIVIEKEAMMKTAVIIFLSLGLAGCSSLPPDVVKEPEKYQAAFNYTLTTETASPNFADITFSIAEPVFQTKGKLMWFASEQFASFPDTLKQDMQKILIGKGFGIRGPYSSRDMIPFQDKKDIDLYLVPRFELSVNVNDFKEKPENMWVAAATIIQTGNVEISGSFKIEMQEIATNELLWVKTIPVKDFSFPFTGYVTCEEYTKTGSTYKPGQIYNFTSVLNGMAKGLEQQYPELMATLDKLIATEEMKILQTQAQELKKKRGY